MAFQQNLQESAPEFYCFGDVSPEKNRKPVPPSENSAGFCECNICLDSAREPVVTLCGHLYCWPCIYRWLHVQTSSVESGKQAKCPVCKSLISNSSLVPLYGRGNIPSLHTKAGSKRSHHLDLIIPSRPAAPGGSILHLNQQTHPNPSQPLSHMFDHPQPFGSYAFGPGEAMTAASVSNPFVGMVGEMVCAMIFRSSDSSLFAAYPYQNPYPFQGNASPRMRRQVMQVEKSLNRLTMFFFCCFLLCFLLF